MRDVVSIDHDELDDLRFQDWSLVSFVVVEDWNDAFDVFLDLIVGKFYLGCSEFGAVSVYS